MPRDLIEQPVVDEVGKILLDGADRMDRNGYCKGALVDMRGRNCAIGALIDAKDNCFFVVEDDSPMAHAIRRLATEMHRTDPLHDGTVLDRGLARAHGSYVANWNNHPKRTQEDVTGAMRRAAYAT